MSCLKAKYSKHYTRQGVTFCTVIGMLQCSWSCRERTEPIPTQPNPAPKRFWNYLCLMHIRAAGTAQPMICNSCSTTQAAQAPQVEYKHSQSLVLMYRLDTCVHARMHTHQTTVTHNPMKTSCQSASPWAIMSCMPANTSHKQARPGISEHVGSIGC